MYRGVLDRLGAALGRTMGRLGGVLGAFWNVLPLSSTNQPRRPAPQLRNVGIYFPRYAENGA